MLQRTEVVEGEAAEDGGGRGLRRRRTEVAEDRGVGGPRFRRADVVEVRGGLRAEVA